MSREDVEVIRSVIDPYDGEEWASGLQQAFAALDLDDTDAVTAWMAAQPGGRHYHPDIVWDVGPLGAAPSLYRGLVGLATFWRDWAGQWESYLYRVVEYRDLGDWVLTPFELEARGRDGLPLRMQVFQLWHVREGKAAIMRAFPTEAAALDAAQSPP